MKREKIFVCRAGGTGERTLQGYKHLRRREKEDVLIQEAAAGIKAGKKARKE